jgi:hypothetical protein
MNTWAQLPAVTLPLPITLSGSLGEGSERTSAPEATEGERWSSWGAARHGARVTLMKSQTVALVAVAAVVAISLIVLRQDLLIALAGLMTAA